MLYNAGEHYPGSNCTSIMGHSYENPPPVGQCGSGSGSDIVTTVKPHDEDDYLAAYGIEDAPNAAYVTMFGSGTLVHWFEGGYQGGNGVTVHAEKYNRLFWGAAVDGGFSFYADGPRKADNQEDATPENDTYAATPPLNAEWCFYRFGRAGGVDSSEVGYLGPGSKRYCITREGPGNGKAFFTSDRNGNAHFRVWNFTGGPMTNVQLRTHQSGGIGDLICSWSSISDNSSSSTCSVNIAGPGFLDIWYCCTLVDEGNIGYDQ